MKKTLLAIISLLTLTIFVGCGESEVSVFREVKPGDDGSAMMMQYISTEDWTYEDFVDLASNVFKGTFVKYTDQEENGSYDLIFKVNENLKGECPEEEVYVHIVPSNWVDDRYEEYNFIKGHEYLLVTERHVMRSLDHDRYYPIGDMFIPLTDKLNSYMNYQPMVSGSDLSATVSLFDTNQETPNENLLLYTTAFCEDSPQPAPVDIPYLRSNSLSEVMHESEYVLLVTVNEPWRRDSGIYYCSVDEVIKNCYSVPEEIVIPFVADGIVSGQSYYMLLNRAGNTSDWFAESSPISMIDADNTDDVSELMSLLENS